MPPAVSPWETMVTLILARLEALVGVGLGVCLLFRWSLRSSLSRPSTWSLGTGTETHNADDQEPKHLARSAVLNPLLIQGAVQQSLILHDRDFSKHSLEQAQAGLTFRDKTTDILLLTDREMRRVRTDADRRTKRRKDTHQRDMKGCQEECISSPAYYVS